MTAERLVANPKTRTGRPGWDARTDEKIRRQNAVLEGLAQGKTVIAACTAAGVTGQAHQHWRKDAKYRVAAEAAKFAGRAGRDETDKSYRYNFAEFRFKFFGLTTYDHQLQLVDALQSVKPGEVVMCNIFPESGKTTTVEDWICQTLALDPNRRITMVSEADGLCRKTTGRIKSRMTDVRMFAEYIATYGPFYDQGQERAGKPWKSQYFTVAKSSHDERDYSLEARAVTSAALGSRIDDLVLDDIQSRRSLSQTKTILEHIRSTYLTRGRHMRTVINGNRLDRGDVYDAFIEEGIVDRVISIPAIQRDGTVTGPEMWARREDFETEEEWLAVVQAKVDKKRLQVGERMWFAMYQQIPHANELATFTDKMMDEAKDRDRSIVVRRSGYNVLSLDPGLGGGNALTACEYRTDKLVVLDQMISYKMASTEDILVNIEEGMQRYSPSLLIIERDGHQKHFRADDRLVALCERYGVQTQDHTTSRNKSDPMFGVASMPSSFMRREIRFPYGDEMSRIRTDALVHQLRSWRADVPTKLLVQDAVMSLWFNWRNWRQWLEAHETTNMHEQWHRQGMPYHPTDYVAASLR